MTDTDVPLRRKTTTTGLARAFGVLLASAAIAAIAAPAAMAEGPASLAASANSGEMAEALAYAGSHSEGYWKALTQAVAEQRAAAEKAAAEEKAAADRTEQANQAILDASTYGRRIEETIGEGELKGTKITEFIPSASGDIIDGEIYVRTTWEVVAPDGTKKISTVYYAPNSGRQLGVVDSEVKDGVETVTQVVEYVPGSIDVKEGDERPVPPEGSSAAGKKPHTWDPKADGSLGKASGGQPDGGAKLQPTNTTPAQETPAGGTRIEFEPIELPDGRVITPFIEERPLEDLPFRSGVKIENPAWGDTFAEVAAYFDVDGKVAGAVGRVIEGGKDTIVAVEELKPGSLGLKKGDSRPAPADILKGNVPSTWAPKKESGSGSGTTTGGTSGTPTSNSGTTDNTGSGTSDAERSKPEPAPDDSGADPAPSSSGNDGSTEPATSGGSGGSGGSGDDGWHLVNHGEESTDDNGNTVQTDTYQMGQENLFMDVSTKTDGEGNSTTSTACYSSGNGSKACPTSMTEDPTCQVDCARLAMLTELFFCASGPVGSECGVAPEGLRPNPSADPSCEDQPSGSESDSSPNRIVYSSGQREGTATPDCSYADKPGGSADYGDPTDPNGGDPPDPSQIPYLQNDGVTDPVNPGEPEEMAGGSTRLDMYGTLRDPANPPGTEDSAPGPGAPDTGEAERRVP